ncbi:MAG: mannose-1-phosphate guanyltransferase, partial [Verrucomicrobia bacterium 21-51-4]
MSNRYIVILAGGRGERFWPQSRLEHPKHLLPIVGECSMLSQTVARVTNVVPLANVFIITNLVQRAAVLADCPQLKPEQVISEPIGRDTAGAVALATAIVKHKDPKATFGLLPADHVIHDTACFATQLEDAFKVADAGDYLVTLGIQPTGPATAYGYICKGASLAVPSICSRVFMVKHFAEKPTAELAQQYVSSGHYYWNAGMFVWRISAIEAALKAYCPQHGAQMDLWVDGLNRGDDVTSLLAQSYSSLPKISIDYAVMEKAPNVVCIEATFDWDDVGEWPAIARHFPGDESHNVVKGPALLEDCQGNIVVTENGHLTAL